MLDRFVTTPHHGAVSPTAFWKHKLRQSERVSVVLLFDGVSTVKMLSLAPGCGRKITRYRQFKVIPMQDLSEIHNIKLSQSSSLSLCTHGYIDFEGRPILLGYRPTM